MNEKQELKAFIAGRESSCDECGEKLGRHAWIVLAAERRALCLACADLDYLVFLAPGDAALSMARPNCVGLSWLSLPLLVPAVIHLCKTHGPDLP